MDVESYSSTGNGGENLDSVAKKLDAQRKELEGCLQKIKNQDVTNGQRYYYDLLVGQMINPFVDLVQFCKKHNKGEFALNCLVGACAKKINLGEKKSTNNVFEELTHLVKDDEQGQEEIKKIVGALDHFSYRIRLFLFRHCEKKDFVNECGFWPASCEPPHFYEKGQMIGVNILRHILSRTKEIKKSKESDIRKLVDNYLRENIARSYKFNNQYTYDDHVQNIGKINELKTKIAENYSKLKSYKTKNHVGTWSGDSKRIFEYYQIPYVDQTNFDVDVKKSKRTIGIEHEHNLGEKNLAKIREKYSLKENEVPTGEQIAEFFMSKKVIDGYLHYSLKRSSDVYTSEKSGGLLEKDESVSGNDGTEYSSPPRTFGELTKEGINVLTYIDHISKTGGYVKFDCALHTHVDRRDIDIDKLKIFYKRVLEHEDFIMKSICMKEMRDGIDLFNAPLNAQLRVTGTEKEKIENRVLLNSIVHLAKSKQELKASINSNHKYHFVWMHGLDTLEFRYKKNTMCLPLIKGFTELNLGLVESVVKGSSIHYDRKLLNKLSVLHKQDLEDRVKEGGYYGETKYYKCTRYNCSSSNMRDILTKEQKCKYLAYLDKIIYPSLEKTGKLKIYDARETGSTRNFKQIQRERC